jgi:glyoxylase-like metal-dependent hydrolase (beta-lactamase superfamily II)
MRLSDKCYAVLGLGCYPPWVVNSGFVVGSKKTLVIDSSAGYLTAQTIYGYAKSVNPSNEILLVNSEKHLDHIGGNCLFAEKGIEIYGHELNKRKEEDLNGDIDFYNSCIKEKIRRESREEKIFYEKTKIVNHQSDVADNQVFDLGEIEAEIIFTPGHTETNISIYVPSEKVIYSGDTIVQGYIPNLASGNVNAWNQWLNSLDIISSLDLNVIIPGHGNVLFNDEITAEIDRIRFTLLKAIETGKTPTSYE